MNNFWQHLSFRIGLLSFLTITFTMVIFASCGNLAEYQFYPYIPLKNLNLNRSAQELTSSQLGKFPGAHMGFIWNNDDNTTLKWRPQGITGFKTSTKRFLAVSWYGREQEGYSNCGVRVSFLDTTKMNTITYRHVLLVDNKYKTFEGMHAGGLVYYHGKLHVPDTRRRRNYKIHVFSVDDIQAVPESDKVHFYNFKYILKQESSYSVPIPPSFLSFDWNREQVLFGSFNKNRNKEFKNRLAWYTIGSINSNSSVCAPFFYEMQGAGSAEGALWVASSYGLKEKSHLYIAPISKNFADCPSIEGPIRDIQYPPGLEDIYISSLGDIWMLTEFGPAETIPPHETNHRIVFATKKDKLLPSKSLGSLPPNKKKL